MTEVGLTRDVVLCMMEHVEAPDFLNVCLANSTIYAEMFSHEVIWRRYVEHNAADSSWKGIGFGEISWKELVRMVRMRIPLNRRKSETGKELSKEMRKIHIRKRLELPPSSKDYLRVFLEVTTDNPKIPKVIVPGIEVPYIDLDGLGADKSEMTFAFQPKEGGTFLVWNGEGKNYSVTSIYFIDRRSTPPRIELSLIGWTGGFRGFHEKEYRSTLGKKDYAIAGEVLHNDSKFYEGDFDKPNLAIKCITRVIQTISTNVLYHVFVKGVEPSNANSDLLNITKDL